MIFFRRDRSDGIPTAPGQRWLGEQLAANNSSAGAAPAQNSGSIWDRFSSLRPVQVEKPEIYRAGTPGMQSGGRREHPHAAHQSSTARDRRGSPPSYYTLLGVPRNATREQVERAYRQHVVRIHPDKFFQDQQRHKRAAAQLRALNAIMQVLRDPDERARYDATLDGLPLASRLGPVPQRDRQAETTPASSDPAATLRPSDHLSEAACVG